VELITQTRRINGTPGLAGTVHRPIDSTPAPRGSPARKSQLSFVATFCDGPDLGEAQARTVAAWAVTTQCTAFRIYVAPHTRVSDEVSAAVTATGGELVVVSAAT